MKFNEYPYKRPNISELQENFNDLLNKFIAAKSFMEQNNLMVNITELRNEFETMKEIAGIRSTIDTTDKLYEEEQSYFDENTPIYEELVFRYYNALLNSKYKKELEVKWGKQIFILAGLAVKTFSPEIIEDLKEENKLSSEYTKLLASARIMFEGKERNLAMLYPFVQDINRNIRKAANEAKFDFFKKHGEELDRIYDNLVKVRTVIAKKIGYKNFVEVGYARMQRSDYNVEMVSNYRKQVEKYIVPIANNLREKQRIRLGLDTLYYFDENITYKDGNAIPKGILIGF